MSDYNEVTVHDLQLGDVTIMGYMLVKKVNTCNGWITLAWLRDTIQENSQYHAADIIKILKC